MSRIVRGRIEPGDKLESSDLDTRYADYQQTDINVDNVTNAAFDNDQMPTSTVLIDVQQDEIGQPNDIAHISPATIAMTTTGPATPTAVNNSAVNLDGANGWTLDAGTTMRVYWNLQARSELSTPAPHASGIMGALPITNPGGATFGYCNMGAHCWLIQLQWNVTSSLLAPSDFVNVPGQGGFQTLWGSTGKYAEPVSSLDATTAMPAMWAGSVGWYQGGRAASSTFQFRDNGWRNNAGSWVYEGSGQTVYGLRLVVHGVYHPYNDGTNNGLALETGFGAGTIAFKYSLGNILAMHMQAD